MLPDPQLDRRCVEARHASTSTQWIKTKDRQIPSSAPSSNRSKVAAARDTMRPEAEYGPLRSPPFVLAEAIYIITVSPCCESRELRRQELIGDVLSAAIRFSCH